MDKQRRLWLDKKTEVARGRIVEFSDFTRKDRINRGDRYLFRCGPSNPVSWVAVFHVKDDPLLWYFVAADSFSFVGSCDVPVARDGDPTSLVLRCNHGMWIHLEDLPICVKLEKLGSEIISHAHEKLELLTKGELISTPNCHKTDEEEDYLAWCESIDRAANFLENLIHALPAEYVLGLSGEPALECSTEAFALAAAGPEKHSDGNDDREVLRTSHETDAGGTLEVTQAIASDELDLAYRPKSDEQPELLFLVNGVPFQSSWGEKVGNLYLLDKSIPTVNGISTLTFGTGKQVRIKFPNAT